MKPSSMQVKDMTIHGLSSLLKSGEITALELTGAALSRAKETEGDVHAYITLLEDEALAAAKRADERLRKGEGDILTGIPIALKDNFDLAGVRTTAASKMLEHYVPATTAPAAQRLLERGAVITGKTNLDECAMGLATDTSYFGRTNNPLNTVYVPGGSSGGSAASVAAFSAVAALGSDTAASVRVPAAYCGLVGFKPTYGRITLDGIVPLVTAFDHVGTLTRDVQDAAILYAALLDEGAKEAESWAHDLRGSWLPMSKLGIVKEIVDAADDEMREATYAAAEKLQSYGAEVYECSLPSAKYGSAVWFAIAAVEIRRGFIEYGGQKLDRMLAGVEVKRRTLLGEEILLTAKEDIYENARRARALIGYELDQLFDEYDALLMPGATFAPWQHKGEYPLEQRRMRNYATLFANLNGMPSLTMPTGKAQSGLPLSLQLCARCGADRQLLQLCRTAEAVLAQ